MTRIKKFRDSDSPAVGRVHVQLANIYRLQRRYPNAWTQLNAVLVDRLNDQGRADYSRVQGLLWIEEKQFDKGRIALKEALDFAETRHGPDQWQTKLAREELARAESKETAGRTQ